MPKTKKMFEAREGRKTYAILDPADFITKFDDDITAYRRVTVEEFVGDGDTVDLKALGRLPVRFLGIDAGETGMFRPLRISEFNRNKKAGYMKLGNSLWQEFLTDPLSTEWEPYNQPLNPELIDNLSARWGVNARDNHLHWANKARARLVGLIREDLESLGRSWKNAEFYTAYGTELLDAYGRLLCFINIKESNPNRRPKYSYNERLMQEGLVIPYFIWPNVAPFNKLSILEAVRNPVKFRTLANDSKALSEARQWCREARAQPESIYDPAQGLWILPFELRYLSNRIAPKRYVIDLGAQTSDNQLLSPSRYIEIPKLEDRLFIPAEYAPLFEKHGWQIC